MLSCRPANRCVWLCAGIILLAPAGLLSAQFPESKVISEPKGAESTGATQSADLLLNAAQRDPTIATILGLPRKTPVDTLVSVFTLLDLGEPRVAEKLLVPLLQRQLTAPEQASLVSHFGSAKFLRLARFSQTGDEVTANGDTANGPLDAAVRQFATDCLAAAAERNQDPKRIASLVAQLHDPQAELRVAARVDLQTTGSAGVVACLQALAILDSNSTAKADHQGQRTHLMMTLVGLHPATDAPLLAMLTHCSGSANCNEFLARDLAEMAGYLRIPTAIPWLANLAACATDSQASQTAREALANMGISPPDSGAVKALVRRKIDRLQKVGLAWEQDRNLWWRWSPVKGQLTSHEFSSSQLKTLTLARLSNLLISCGNPSPAERQLALIYTLEALPLAESSQPLAATQLDPAMMTHREHLANSLRVDPLLVDQWSADQLSATLSEAIKRGQFKAAIAVTRLLGQLGDRRALVSHQDHSQGGRSPRGRPSPLVRTLRHPYPELRFAALSALMELAPKKSFAGSSYLPEALWAFSASSGSPVALVISPLARRRYDWAGQLHELDYEAIPVATGREALQVAARSSRLALILADANVGRPTVREVHYQLRASTQAGHVPMAIVCSGEQVLEFDRLAAVDPLFLVAVRPTEKIHLAKIVEHLQQLANPPLASDAVRLQRAEQALNWLTQLLQLPLSSQGNLFHELRRNGQIAETTLFQPELATASLRLLEHLGTANSQLKLLDYASGKNLPIENRQRAVKGFASSVNQYGILLTTDQIRSQYDRYNASQSDDHQTQQILGELLDVLESDQ